MRYNDTFDNNEGTSTTKSLTTLRSHLEQFLPHVNIFQSLSSIFSFPYLRCFDLHSSSWDSPNFKMHLSHPWSFTQTLEISLTDFRTSSAAKRTASSPKPSLVLLTQLVTISTRCNTGTSSIFTAEVKAILHYFQAIVISLSPPYPWITSFPRTHYHLSSPSQNPTHLTPSHSVSSSNCTLSQQFQKI